MSRRPVEPKPEPVVRLDVVERGAEVDYLYAGDILLAAVRPPRPHDLPDQWRALDREGRAVEVNTRAEAMRRARQYAENLVPTVIAEWVREVGW